MIKEKKQSKSFEQKFKEIEKQSPNGRDFFSAYVVPVQRYPRYTILLRELDKNTIAFHPDKVFLTAAGSAAAELNKNLDEMSRKVKYLHIFVHLAEIMPNFATLHHHGELLLENEVKIEKSPGFLYSFNDIVVLEIKYKKSSEVKFMKRYEELQFFTCKPTQESITFVVDNEPYAVFFNEVTDRQTFVNNLTMQVKERYANNSQKDSYIEWLPTEIISNLPDIQLHKGCFSSDSALFLEENY
jgi:hypothetical protein